MEEAKAMILIELTLSLCSLTAYPADCEEFLVECHNITSSEYPECSAHDIMRDCLETFLEDRDNGERAGTEFYLPRKSNEHR